ncbi:ABC transporter ATP-binding protein [Psychromonas sp. Urea-02u-13]|uniref:ABC transporter ATP-binding protein n=1 Tax=Psychromonas sp. Urea-02u-13 TaxID=2058326 RepID=UPI000C325B2E|nr:dipeptide ABC transporter ATP-binding protein [Psychromonas sp. Urea-02u-13]PKG37629.1 microcin ABC transporter ATP-binding protein [Psychromonas sp. Urea-02u-13]
MSNPSLLSVDNLSISFAEKSIVRNVSFQLERGKTLAIVGESGAGKSLLALSILQLLPYPEAHHPTGEITLNGEALVGKCDAVLEAVRGNKVSMIFQEPMTSLNPLHTVQKQIAETLLLHKGIVGKEALNRTIELLNLVGIEAPETRLKSYPHELSGGQRQRIMIAMALANDPELLIADEPTTALDVTIQKQILGLLASLQQRLNMAILLITHDLCIVKSIAHDVIVMRNGEVVEKQAKQALFDSPKSAYTKLLLDAVPCGEMTPLINPELLLSADNIHVSFAMEKNFWGKVTTTLDAVKGVSLAVHKGETVAIVGESGSGKSTLAQAILQLNKSTGKVVFLGQQIDSHNKKSLQAVRSKLQIVFQDPFASLSPRLCVGDIIAEGLEVHQPQLTIEQVEDKVNETLLRVGLDKNSASRYPHQFSGGQRQRISIARALILNPELIILDEPTSALDRSIQKQILDLLVILQAEFSLSYLFISHDLSVVRAMSHRVLVMKAGEVVEQGFTNEIFSAPKQQYTKILLSSALL